MKNVIFKKKQLNEMFDNEDQALADSLKFTDPRDGKPQRCWWDEDGAYPFSYYGDEIYIGDESTMHSDPCAKYIKHCINDLIESYGIYADQNTSIQGTFHGYNYEKGEFCDFYWEDLQDMYYNESKLVDSVSYNIYDDERYGKCVHVVIYYQDDEEHEFDTEVDYLKTELEIWITNQATCQEVYEDIIYGRGQECSDGKLIDVNEEVDEDEIDLRSYLEADYEPTSKEVDEYIQESYDSGRYWVYDKIIAMWNGIDNYFGNIIDDLSQATGIDFLNTYYVVYNYIDGEDLDEVRCEPVSVVLARLNGEEVGERKKDDRYINGFVPHVPSQLENPNDMDSFYKERKNALQGFINDRNAKMHNKLAMHDKNGNYVGDMPLAKYHHLIHAESKNNKKKIIVTEKQLNTILESELYK